MSDVLPLCTICVKRKLEPPRSGPHVWSTLHFCCQHFDELVVAMFDVHEAVNHQKHQEYIDLFQRGVGQKQGPCEGGGSGNT